MKPEAQRIAIAEACGWIFKPNEFGWSFAKIYPDYPWVKYGKGEEPFPDYLNDLNAMHEAEKVLNAEQWAHYNGWIAGICTDNYPIMATAPQRAEAFLRTLDLWED